MEHRIISRTGSGFCSVKVCSCGEHYLVIGKACLRMTQEGLDLLAGLMVSWKDRSLAPPPLLLGEMDAWPGPSEDPKVPCLN